MDKGAHKQTTKKEVSVISAEACKDFIERLQRKYKFLKRGDKNFDGWDHYDASEVLADFIAFLRDHDAED